MNEDDPRTWAPLSHLTALTSLVIGTAVDCRLPPQLAACAALAELQIADDTGLVDEAGEAPEAWVPLQHLTALTKYDGPFGPAALPLLPASMQELCLIRESAITSQAELDPFSRLTALTRLDLSSVELQLFPAALSACSALCELLLRHAECVDLPEASFQPLAHLTALTRLSLRCAQMAAVPPALAASTALIDLDLGGSMGPISQDPAGEVAHSELGHLSRLASLTRLQVGQAVLRAGPSC